MHIELVTKEKYLLAKSIGEVQVFLAKHGGSIVDTLDSTEKIYGRFFNSQHWVWKDRVWEWKFGAPKIEGFVGPMRGDKKWRYERMSK